jgi:diacylglycerol kinase
MYVFLAYLVLLSAEAFNTSIEKLADYASAYKRHHLIGKVKDMAAAATLFIGVGVLVVWVYIFLPHIIS